MDVSKKPACNDKKMVVKMGSGGLGTVILLGGALATAAFVSAFMVGLKKRQNSVAKRYDEPAKKSEANDEKVHEFVFVDKVTSDAVSKEIESGGVLLGDAQSLKLDAKTDIDNDGNGVEQSGDDEMKEMHHEKSVEVTETGNEKEENVEECCDQEGSGLLALEKTVDELHNDEIEAEKIHSESKTAVESNLSGETQEVKFEGVEKMRLDFAANTKTNLVEGIHGDERVNDDPMEVEGNPSKEVTCDDEEPPVMEHRNADSDVKDGVLPTDREGASVKYVVEEEFLEEQKEIDQFGEEISCEIIKQVNEGLSYDEHENSEEVGEENFNNVNEPRNQELGDYEKIVENLTILGQEMISSVPENDIETSKEVDESSKTIDIDAEENARNEADLSATTDTEKASLDPILEINESEKGETETIVDYDEMELSDEVEESSVGTGESSTDSNLDAVWPAEESSETRQVNLINQEVAGKALEDKKPDAGNDFHDREINSDKESLRASIMDSSIYRNTVKKYLSEFSMVKDQPENAVKKGMLILIFSVFSSYSCSWLFGCSFVKLSLIMFFSIILSKIHGY